MALEQQVIPVAVQRVSRASGGPDPAGHEHFSAEQACVTPLIDIHEGPEGLVLEADLPGVSEENVSIELEENVLTLHASVAPALPEGARPLHEEFRVANYQRSFILSEDVERSKITAELRNGVLRLTLPKAERAKTRRIEIKS